MNILFIYNAAENLGIEYLSSFLKSHGHKTHLLFDQATFSGDILINNKILAKMFSNNDRIVREAVSLSPDLIAFSSYTGNYNWCLKIARKIKKNIKVPIVFGGVHTTSVPQEVLKNDFIDYVIVGEGEYALIELINHIKSKKDISKIYNLGYKLKNKVHINNPRKYIRDLDELPFPDKNLFYNKVPILQESYRIITSRGCPFDCTYCSNNMFHQLYSNEINHIRRRSPKNVIKELKWAKVNWNIKLIDFVDDVFTASRQWLEEFIPLYKSEINIPFFCSTHPLSMSKEIAQLLKSGGCCLVTIGVQSGSERIRKNIFNRHGNNKRVLESIKYVKDAKIKISVDNIFGVPTETMEDLKKSLYFYKKVNPDRIITFWLMYYPNTKIIDIAKDKNCISEKEIDEINRGFIGFTHDGRFGIKSKKRKTYIKYALLLQLISLFNNDLVCGFISRLFLYFPFKPSLIRMVFILNAIKNKDRKVFNLVRYIWTHKNIP